MKGVSTVDLFEAVEIAIWELAEMKRRDFVTGGAALASAILASGASTATQSGRRPRKATRAAKPKFLWGASIAGHQVEGNNTNSDYWVLEQIPGGPFRERSLDTCDHYHRYAEDIGLVASSGLNALRLGIEWARVEPEEGYFSIAVLEHYRRVLAACHERGVTPVLTYHHFTSPRWLAMSGGWAAPSTADRFARYCERVTKHLGDLVGVACTLNEPNFTMLLDRRGFIPVARRAELMAKAAKAVGSETFSCPPFSDPERTSDICIAAHHKAVEVIKSGRGTFPVGMTLSLMDFQATPGGEEAMLAIRKAASDRFLEALRGDDFVGVQAYTRRLIGPDGPLPPPPSAQLTQMGDEVWPQATENCVRHAHAVAGTRIIVTESGIATADDRERVRFIDATIAGIRRCRADGIPIDGYFHWSLIDNFEWVEGYVPHFGLIAVDRTNFVRTPKPSLYHLGRLAKRRVI